MSPGGSRQAPRPYDPREEFDPEPPNRCTAWDNNRRCVNKSTYYMTGKPDSHCEGPHKWGRP